jgi:predicted nucleic acid-binding protein
MHEAEVLIRIRKSLRNDDRPVRRRALDLQIAATAIAHGLALVTNDPDDYIDIPELDLLPARIDL